MAKKRILLNYGILLKKQVLYDYQPARRILCALLISCRSELGSAHRTIQCFYGDITRRSTCLRLSITGKKLWYSVNYEEFRTRKMGISLKGRGMIISLEGIDASGKFTQSNLLYKVLQNKSVRTVYTSFPDYTTTIGQEIRAFLSQTKNYTIEARHMLFSLNRLEHKKEIEAWLNEGDIVVVNRYCDSNLAYGGASGLSIEWLRSLESEMPQSNYVYYLRAKPDLSKERKTRSRDKFEMDLAFLERVVSVYDTLAESPNWFTIDANNSVESVHYEILKITEELLKEHKGKEIGLVDKKEKPLKMQSRK